VPNQEGWTLQTVLAEYLETVWREPDSSLWEVRGPRHHFVHSKVMAWVGFDRMIRTAERSGLARPVDRWRAARDAVHREVCEQGYDPERGTFTQFYGSRGLARPVRATARPAQRRGAAQRGAGPHAERQLGNTPQAFSHVGLVNTALTLEHDLGHVRTDHG
jgi:GH15 family glucan-1,4-alpha-glucosidase